MTEIEMQTILPKCPRCAKGYLSLFKKPGHKETWTDQVCCENCRKKSDRDLLRETNLVHK